MLDKEMAAAVKRQAGRTPTKAAEPSPNVAPLKKSKTVAEMSPLKPVSLQFATEASDNLEATLCDPGRSSSGVAAEAKVEGTLSLLEDIAQTDVYNVVPEFGDTLVVLEDDSPVHGQPDDIEVSKVLAQVECLGKRCLHYGFWFWCMPHSLQL